MAQESSVIHELPRQILLFPGATGPDTPAPASRRARFATGDDGDGWDDLCERLLDRWPVLTAGEIEAAHGNPTLIEALLDAKLRYARRLVDEELRPERLEAMRARRRALGEPRGLIGVLGLLSVVGLGFVGLLSG